MPIPDNKIEQFKSLIKNTHGDPKWMKENAKRTEIKSIDAWLYFNEQIPHAASVIKSGAYGKS